MEFEDLTYDVRGPVARIAINRPARLNALRMGISDRALIDDKAFCTGWDMEAIDDTPLDQLETLIRSNLDLFFKVWHSPKPVVAAMATQSAPGRRWPWRATYHWPPVMHVSANRRSGMARCRHSSSCRF